MKLTVKQTARIMGRTEEFIRSGLKANILPIGVAIIMDSDKRRSYELDEYGNKKPKYTFDIQSHLLKNYMGESDFNEAVERLGIGVD